MFHHIHNQNHKGNCVPYVTRYEVDRKAELSRFMSELVDLISDGQMDDRQSVGGQTTDVIDVNGLSRPIGVTHPRSCDVRMLI